MAAARQFLESEAAPIRPLIDELGFIRNKQQWGYPFRQGLFEVERADFERIAGAMNAELEKASRSVSTKR
ncbi:hypothetical protein BH23GEM4_BH23GEM4_10470 [soil metagenome]